MVSQVVDLTYSTKGNVDPPMRIWRARKSERQHYRVEPVWQMCGGKLSNSLDKNGNWSSLDSQWEEDIASICLDTVDDESLLGSGDVVMEGGCCIHGLLGLCLVMRTKVRWQPFMVQNFKLCRMGIQILKRFWRTFQREFLKRTKLAQIWWIWYSIGSDIPLHKKSRQMQCLWRHKRSLLLQLLIKLITVH